MPMEISNAASHSKEGASPREAPSFQQMKIFLWKPQHFAPPIRYRGEQTREEAGDRGGGSVYRIL